MARENALNVYTDGSSFSRPRRGGLAVRVVTFGAAGEEEAEDHVLPGFASATNNEMELLACIRGLEIAEEHARLAEFDRICVFTDSMYVAENVSRAIFQWSKSRWANSAGRPIENAELWKDLVRLIKRSPKRVEVKWVKGHSKDLHNRAVDKLAKASAKGVLQRPLKIASVRRKTSAHSVEVGSVRMRGQTLSVRIVTDGYLRLQRLYKYKYEILPGQEDEGLVDLIFSRECLRSGHSYEVRVNTDSRNPRIAQVIGEIESKG